MPVTSYPPDQMYATPSDDPALCCQCAHCHNQRMVMPSPLRYDADGYDQFGNDADGRDRAGYSHQERHGRPGCQDADMDDLNLNALWSAYTSCYSRSSGCEDAFLAYLRSLARDPATIDDVKFCDTCGGPDWDEDMHSAADGNLSLCEPCYDKLTSCDGCGERYPDDDMYRTLGGSDVCDGCRDNHCTYCEDCGGYYRDDDAYEHDHEAEDEDDCGCESPQMAFAIRNDGDAPLANDTRAFIERPAGVISAEGLKAIRDYLYSQGMTWAWDLMGALGDQWQTKAGNYAKRLSRHAYQAHHVKLTPEVMSQIGCIAREHSTAVSTVIDVTRDLNQGASEFYHEGSCWWTDYSESRCALKTNGGFGLRSFDGRNVSGRAWVLPLRHDEHGDLVPTLRTMTPDAFVVFNGYGDLSGYSAPRIIAHMAGWTYRKIGFKCSPMWLNAGGYLVAPEDIAAPYTDGHLYLSVDQHATLYDTEKELVNA